MRRQLSVYLLGFSFLLPIAVNSFAAGQTFTTVDPPGAVFTLAVGINDIGEIVGRYADAAGITHGFLLSNGTYSSFDFPGATGFTRAYGINSNRQVVGDYLINNVEHGFLLSGRTFTTIDPPGAHGALAEGINTYGDIVGSYFADAPFNGNGKAHGFLLTRGVFTTIDFPGARYTEAWRINDAGQIVGRYQSGDGKYHIYAFSNGSYISIPDVPGAVESALFEVGGFNRTQEIAGTYCSATPCGIKSSGDLHGFLFSGGVYTTIDFPGAAVTGIFGLNSSDDIVGGYIELSGRAHGYLRTP